MNKGIERISKKGHAGFYEEHHEKILDLGDALFEPFVGGRHDGN